MLANQNVGYTTTQRQCELIMLEIILNLTALTAFGLIFYSIIKDNIEHEKFTYLLDVVIIICSLFIALSIYFPINYRPPADISKYFTAPLVVILLIFISSRWLFFDRPPTITTIKGISILAMCGALFRIIVY